MAFVAANPQAIAQQELENYLHKQSQLVAPDTSNIKVKTAIAKTEVDAVPDVFGALYRVWDGMQLLGTFYEKIDGSWLAQPCNSDYHPIVKTSDQAHLVIVASWLQK